MPDRRGSEPARYEGWAAIEQAQNLMRSAFSHAMDGQKAKAQRLYDSALDHFRAAVGEAKRRESELAEELEVLRESELEWQRREDRSIRAEARVAELERALQDCEEFLIAARPLLGMSVANSLGARADKLLEALGARREATGE